MNHCKECGNNIPPDVQNCEQAGFGDGDGCGQTVKNNIHHKESGIEAQVVDYMKDGFEMCASDFEQALLTAKEEGIREERERILQFVNNLTQEHHYNTSGIDMDLVDRKATVEALTQEKDLTDSNKEV